MEWQDEGYLELADLEANEYHSDGSGLWTRGLLIRRTLADGACAHFTTGCPAGTAIETLVAVEGQRWTIEDSFETAKNEFGLDHNESRSWHGWHQHVSLVMLAFAMMATIRHHANQLTSQHPKNAAPPRPDASDLIRWSIQEIRRVAIRLAQQRTHPAYVIAWSTWRRAHQATAKRCHVKKQKQM